MTSRPAKPSTHKVRGANLLLGALAGAIALAALVVGSSFGNMHPARACATNSARALVCHRPVDPILIALACAVGLVAFGVVATQRISHSVGSLVGMRGVRSAAVAARLFTAGVGYLIVVFAVLAVLDVSIGKLLLGAGLAGVVLGIAAQPSLGNIFAGVVLVLARPFSVGDHIRVRSGALGGVFDAWVVDLSLAYITLQTEDGLLRIPNSGMLAAGVLQLTPTSQPLPAPAGSVAAGSAPAPPAGPESPADGAGGGDVMEGAGGGDVAGAGRGVDAAGGEVDAAGDEVDEAGGGLDRAPARGPDPASVDEEAAPASVPSFSVPPPPPPPED